MGPLFLPTLLNSPSHPRSFFNLLLISIIFFGQIELGGPHTPLFSYFLPIPISFLFGLYGYIYMDRIKKKTKLISPFSHFFHLISSASPELKLGPPHPQILVYCLFEVCATVTDTVFNCT